VRINQRV